MSSPLMAILAIAPIAALISLSASMYKWEQQHLQAESLAGDYIFTCREAAYREILVNQDIPKDQMEKIVDVLAGCDDNMLYYKGRCELQPTKDFCSNSSLDGYLILRGIENAERPAGFTKT
jgi:hypothetical protein